MTSTSRAPRPARRHTGGDESPAILANQAMQQIATPGNYFYQPQPTQLVGVFDAITADLAKGTSRING